MWDSVQVLIMCISVALFMMWVMQLKQEIVSLKRDVDQLRQVAVTKAREGAAPKKARTSSPPTKLYGVWGDKS